MRPTEFGDRLSTLVKPSSLARIQHAMGKAGKESATKAAKRDLGPDQAFSNMKRKVKLASGYDLDGDDVILHLRPKGLWKLATDGRRRQGTIYPKRGHSAVRTPRGFRSLSHYSPSRGLHTVDDAIDDMRRTVPVAAAKALDLITKDL